MDASARSSPSPTRLRSAWSRVRVLPAKVPSGRRTPPMHFCTAWRPSMYSPSGMPVAAVESVTQYRRGMARRATLMAPGCTCSRSGISSAYSACAKAAPTMPGSRWCRPLMALNRCVKPMAPCSSAATPSSYEPSVWPICTRTPASASARTRSRWPAISGATVMTRSLARVCRRSISARVAARA
ncbi:hypothetical protein D3C72_1680800 [compost metagenome]